MYHSSVGIWCGILHTHAALCKLETALRECKTLYKLPGNECLLFNACITFYGYTLAFYQIIVLIGMKKKKRFLDQGHSVRKRPHVDTT